MFKEESTNIEFKEIITNSFLKTVSAFANYNDGKIIFGIDNEGNIIGIQSNDQNRLKIENMINDSFNPRPHYNLEVIEEQGKTLIVLNIYEGTNKPYYYQNKAYKRHDTSTVEVDRYELNRLVLEGMNINYEEMKSTLSSYNFEYLEDYLKVETGIKNFSDDILKTLKLLYKDGSINIAGELLSDDNKIKNAQIDIIKFGASINQILYREVLSSNSILWQYDEALKIFTRYYEYEEIEGFKRVKKELIPKEAFRESLANAIVHRDWYLNSKIQIAMYDDRIEIISPGGLPHGISKDDYLYKNISTLRNPIIAGVFFRLNIIEQFGTGIDRINIEYKAWSSKPVFEISENNLKIILPMLRDNTYQLPFDDNLVYNLLKKNTELSRLDIDNLTGFNKSKTIRIINSLLEQYLIEKIGDGRNTKYRISI